MSSLKSRIIISFTSSLLIFLLIFAVTVFFGFNLSLKDWNRANEEKLTEEITKSLEKIYSNGNPDLNSIEKTISPLLRENMEITVFSPDGRIIFSHNSGKDEKQKVLNEHFMRSARESFPMMRGMMMDRRGAPGGNEMLPPRETAPPPGNDRSGNQIIPGATHESGEFREITPGFMPGQDFRTGRQFIPDSSGTGMMRNNRAVRQYMQNRLNTMLPEQFIIRPVIADRQVKAFVKVKSLKLKFYSNANRRFINSIIITVLAGTLAALVIAVFSSWFISNKLTRDAAALSTGLNRLAGGRRDVIFPDKGSEEILSISESAAVLQKELIHDEERRKQWAQDIAHDLRTPITAVKAQVEALKDGVFKPDSERFSKVLKELGHLETLVEDMNSLSKIESEQNSLNISPVSTLDIKGILKERFDLLAEEKKIDFILEAENFSVECDLHLLIRALSNLAQNSINYSAADSSVKVNMLKKEDSAVFIFENPGNIEETEIEKIFDRLYRGETGRSSEGSGLGLTIASAIIRRHGGGIAAENRGKSIIFTVSIPIRHEQV